MPSKPYVIPADVRGLANNICRQFVSILIDLGHIPEVHRMSCQHTIDALVRFNRSGETWPENMTILDGLRSLGYYPQPPKKGAK